MAVATGTLARTRNSTGSGERTTTFDRVLQVVAYVVLISAALLMFVPFYFSVTTSLKTSAEANRIALENVIWPANPTLAAYRQVVDSDILRWFFNSTFIAAIWMIGRAFADSMAGYAFARMRFPGRDLVFLMVLSTLMIPGMVTIVPRFILLNEMGLLNTYGALTLPFLADAFGIFLMRQFFESIPVELEEAARIDGASRYRMFAQIILPNAMPALTALAIFSFQGSWNAFLEPLLFNNRPELRTLPVGLAYFREANAVNWPVMMAGAVVTTVPMALVFFAFQRFFVEGVTTSGIKG
jgi:multiple sugar transport system permease protein